MRLWASVGPGAGVRLGVGARLRAGGWRLRCAQEPSRGRRHAGPGIVVGGLPVGWLEGLPGRGLPGRGWLRRGWPGRGWLGRGWLRGIVGLPLTRSRNHQAWRHGPGGNQIFRIIPAEQACTLPLLLRRGSMLTISTRLVTLCTHHRPQSRHISGKMPYCADPRTSRPYGMTRGLMLPTESKCVQRAIFWGKPDQSRDLSPRHARHHDLCQGLAYRPARLNAGEARGDRLGRPDPDPDLAGGGRSLGSG